MIQSQHSFSTERYYFPDMKKYLLSLNLFAGVALGFVPFVLFPVCEMLKPDGTPMGCYYSGIFITCMGGFIALLTLGVFFTKKFITLYAVSSIVAACLCWLVPNRVIAVGMCGLCGNPEHACRSVTMPAVSVIAVIIVVSCAALLVMNLITGRN